MKRLLALILALLMLALPVCGLAEGDFISEAVENGRKVERTTTFSVMETGEAEVDEIVSVLLEALSIKSYWQEGDATQGGVVLHLNGTDVVSFEMASQGDDRYFASELLGGTVVMSVDDVEAVAQRVTSALVDAGLIAASDAEAFLASITASIEEAKNPAANIDYEAMLKGFNVSEEDVQAWIEKLAARIVEADLSGLPEGCDNAIMAYSITLTADDIVKAYEKIFGLLKGNAEYMKLLDSMLASVENASGADIIDQMLSEMATELPEAVKGDIVTTLYFDGNDEVVAGVSAFVLEVSEGYPVDVITTYTRKTEAGATRHNVVLTLRNTEGHQVDIALAAVVRDNGLDAQLSFVGMDGDSANMAVVLALKLEEQATETERSLDVSVGLTYSEASETIEMMLLTVDMDAKKDGDDAEQTTVIALKYLDEEIFSVTTQSKTVDPAPSIVTDDAVRLAELSDEAFLDWLDSLGSNVYSVLFKGIGALPASLLRLLQ